MDGLLCRYIFLQITHKIGGFKMDFWLLNRVAMAVNGVVYGGYGLAGMYMIRVGIQYVKDYRTSIENEEIEVK